MGKINRRVLVLSFALLLQLSATALGAFYESAPTSPVIMHLAGGLKIEGGNALPGDEVGFFDIGGMLLGSFVVGTEGFYGDAVISGDHKLTPEKEGAMEGEEIRIRVWSQVSGKEYSGGRITVSSPSEGSTAYTPYRGTVLRYEKSRFYLLNIEAHR